MRAELRYRAPEDDPFFAIVGRDRAQLMLKVVTAEVGPMPNPARHEWAPWDAFVHVDDPDGFHAEVAARGVAPHEALTTRDDGLRGFAMKDPDGYVLFLGRSVG